MDIIKRRGGYFNKLSKKKIKDRGVINRIKSLRIPPCYNNVVISKDPLSKIQAIGVDSKKRRQYIYHKDHINKQKIVKFGDLIYFGRKIKRIRKDINYNINRCVEDKENISELDSIISIILYIIDRCNFRVGCQKYKELYNTYGVTTLNKSHLHFTKNGVVIKFIGKKGVMNKDMISNNKICSILNNLIVKNSGDYLFYYIDRNSNTIKVTEKHINNYLKRYHKTITVKMFRTWSANYKLLRELLKYDLPKNVSEAKKNINMAVKKAAGHMHHTPFVSKVSYMNNGIIQLYQDLDNNKFYKMLNFFRKTNGDLPNIDRLLNLILQKIVE
jgi:DNA topoisomerase-1